MSKISVIIEREYVTRVRKKSFILMTLLAPLIMAIVIIVLPMLMMNQDTEIKKIAVIEDKTDLFRNAIPDMKNTQFVYLENVNFDDIKNNFEQAGYYGVLFISPEVINVPEAIQFISRKQPPILLLEHIENSLEKEIERQKLLSYKIENLDKIINSVKTNVSIQTIKLDKSGNIKETNTGISMALAYINSFLIYILVFVFGSQVMRGVIEEKTSRVVELIISSVKPTELMMGKIIGLALVGLTQFMIWVLLTFGIAMGLKSVIIPKENSNENVQIIPQNIMSQEINQTQKQTENITISASEISPDFQKIFKSALNQPWGLIIFSFVFYFITGYLLYASLFAAIGSAVDNETETQQFMFPVTILIILGLFVAIGTMQNPESSISFWFSMIPFTSPIVMMARIPFGVPLWQITISMILMVATFVAFVWMAGKIYRTGILMYGKKVSWKEMMKWLTYRG
ncbi:MAG TPA: ABC transporter permease [Bacteroidales bacterium]|nr:ABC transporter permease [Bacteroidales bacterium]HCI54669.1 ABC transporter permease [Bacteroidales bacterium]HOU96056.1 ABC transporter permease [Bacteroidales bacterium]HQG36456.1 ABC transporter permease [Bacteroidales bacterium]HQG52535.1 ABC transporter permease [Bacteroidales bacterium]